MNVYSNCVIRIDEYVPQPCPCHIMQHLFKNIVLQRSHFLKKILDPVTYEINKAAPVPLYVIIYIMSYNVFSRLEQVTDNIWYIHSFYNISLWGFECDFFIQGVKSAGSLHTGIELSSTWKSLNS